MGYDIEKEKREAIEGLQPRALIKGFRHKRKPG